MKRLMLSFLTVGVLGFFHRDILYSQELTLNEVIVQAVQINPRLQSLNNLIKSKEGFAQQSNVAPNPSLGTDIGNINQYLKFSQEIEYPGKRNARTNAALESVEITRNELLLARLEIERTVVKLFYDVLWAQKTMELLHENLKVTERFREAASYKFNHGFGSKIDVVKAQVEVARSKRLLNTTKQELLVNQNNLKIIMGKDINQPLILKGDLSSPHFQCTNDLTAILRNAYQIHPGMLIEQHRFKASEYNFKAAQLSSKPNINFGLSGGLEDRKNSITLNVDVPLSLWDKKTGAKSEALFLQKSIEYTMESARQNVSQQVTSAFQTYQSAIQIVKLFEDTLFTDTKNAAEMAQTAFETGNFRFLDLIDAQRTFIDASVEYYDSLRSLRQAEIELQFSMGKLSSGGPQ